VKSLNNLRRVGLALLGLASAATSLAFVFSLSSTGMPIKWPAGNIPITIMLGDTTTLFDGSNYNTSARAAALAWNGVIGSAQFQIQLAAAGAATEQSGLKPPQPPINELAFADTLFGKDFDTSTLAVTTGFSSGNERTEADITFNTKNFKWDSYRGFRPSSLSSDTIDIQRVAIHELGHVLGLDHPDLNGQPGRNAIMNSRISLNVDTMTEDDINGAQSLYGPRDPLVPVNDAFASAIAIPLSSNSISVKGVNTNATKEPNEPSHAFDSGQNPKPNPGGRSVWWRWTAPSAGGVTIDTKGSYFDTILGVYTGSTVSSLTQITSNDDESIPTGPNDSTPHVQTSKVTFNASSGTVYRIAVDGFNNIVQNPADTAGADNGGITLNLNFTGTITGTAPVISTQPASVTVLSGGSATFSVTASGTEPLAYQWNFNTNPVAGATNSTFSLSGVTTGQAGTYTVTVSNAVGSTTSTGATLTVNTPAPTPPPSTGGGGGGAPSVWFCAVLAALGLSRFLSRRP